jgi:hypothetical protein
LVRRLLHNEVSAAPHAWIEVRTENHRRHPPIAAFPGQAGSGLVSGDSTIPLAALTNPQQALRPARRLGPAR